MNKEKIICPYCGHKFKPFGVFMLEKIFCPYCGNYFFILKYAYVIRAVYSAAVFIGIAYVYRKIRPQSSVCIAFFWLAAMTAIKALTYAFHKILYFFKTSGEIKK